jgi:hypothetical protein
MRYRWTEDAEKKLIERINTLRTPGTTDLEVFNQVAKEFEVTYDAVSTKYWKLIKTAHKRQIEQLPESRYPLWNAPFSFDGDVLVLCDAHIPLHHARFINSCIKIAVGMGIKRCLLAGDALDLIGMSSFPENFEQGAQTISAEKAKRLTDIALSLPVDSQQRMEIMKELDQSVDDPHNISGEWANARETMTALSKNFEEVLWMMGNHEHRLIRKLEKTISGADLKALFVGDNPKWKVSEYYWCQFTSGGKQWQVEHPNLTAKGGGKRLAPKYKANIIMAHNHHFAIASDSSGEYISIEPGMCGDEERMGYVKQRHNSADTHVLGAVIIKDGRPLLINKYFMEL